MSEESRIAQEELLEEDAVEDSNILIGSGEYLIVGIRYYNGVAHPGEYVELVREPNNPYDRNAIRVDNMAGDKVGHIKATMASTLAPILDNTSSGRLQVRVDGTIPRAGNSYTLPIFLEFFCTAPNITQEQVKAIAVAFKKLMKRDNRFRIAREFGGDGVTASEMANVSGPSVSRKKMNWQQQEEALNNMFDKQLEDQYKDLPDVSMPSCLKGITLYDYQINGVKWLLKKEIDPSPAPFYKQITEKGKKVWFCEITNSSQVAQPAETRGSILCDQMGLGKSIQTICLILLAPPPGVEYKVKKIAAAGEEKEIIPMPEDAIIRSAKTQELKVILKSASLKVSGKKQDLVDRIIKAKVDGNLSGEHFPEAMRPRVGDTSRCTLIVCPVSVISNWTDQIESYVEDGVLSVRLFHGSNRNDLLPEIKSGCVDVLLVSYQTLAADYSNVFGKDSKGTEEPQKKKVKRDSIFDIDFHRIVLDEAHTIRNGKTKFFKAVKEINANRKLAITGTPFVNKSDDVHSLLSFLGVQPLDNKSIFTRAISTPIKNGDDLGLTRLRACMGFVSLRRSKQNVNIKMVEKDVQLCSVEFDRDAHKEVYDALFGTLKVAMEAILSEGDGTEALKHYSSIFEKLLRLRQACCSGTMISEERRKIALNVWEEVKSSGSGKKLSAEEGLTLLKKLQGVFTEDPEELPECGICLTEMEATDGTILKSCLHVFCKLCIRQVLSKSNRKCPYCRADFQEGDIVDMSTAESAANLPSSTKETDVTMFGTPPKIQALLQSIKSMKSDEKGVIFSQFTSYLDLIGDALTEVGHAFVRIDGSVPAQKRIAIIQAFNSDNEGSPRFILCSLLASGTGINLTRGNWAFMMDCWWNEAIETQAMDRIHRLNQTRKVTIQRFVMKDSIEERIVALQEAKSMQAKGVLQKLKGDEKRKALLSDLRGLLDIDQDK